MEEGEDKLKFLCGRLDGDLTKGEETWGDDNEGGGTTEDLRREG
jgi:hypothetical protein